MSQRENLYILETINHKILFASYNENEVNKKFKEYVFEKHITCRKLHFQKSQD